MLSVAYRRVIAIHVRQMRYWCCCSDRKFLYCHLIFSGQLIAFLPFQPCYRDLALETRWSSALFETDLFKLDVSAVLLCLSYGCPSGILILQRPLRNMFALSDFLKHSSASLRSPITPMELSDEIHGRLSQFEWTDHEQRSRRRPQSSSLTTEEWQLVCGDELPNVADFYETKPTDLTEYLLRSVNSFFGSRS